MKDFDEVVVYTTQGYLDYLASEYGIIKEMSDVITYHNMASDLNISQGLSNQTWSEFYEKNLTEECRLSYGFLDVAHFLHREGFEIEILTSRPQSEEAKIIQFFKNRNVPFIKKINCVNTYQGGIKRSKGDVFGERKGNFFAEDTFYHVQDVSSKHPDSVNFLMKRPWNIQNITKDLAKNIKPANDWYAVGDEIQDILTKEKY